MNQVGFWVGSIPLRFFPNRVIDITQSLEGFFDGCGCFTTDIPEAIFELVSEFIEIGFPADQITGNEQAAYAQSYRNAS
jgi:hypothetical protein